MHYGLFGGVQIATSVVCLITQRPFSNNQVSFDWQVWSVYLGTSGYGQSDEVQGGSSLPYDSSIFRLDSGS